MATTLAQLSELVGGTLVGDGSLQIAGAATLETAQQGEITLADHPDRARELGKSLAVAAIVAAEVDTAGKSAIVVDDVHAAFASAVRHFRPRRARQRVGVSAQAVVSPTARIASDVDIHPGAFVGDDVVVGTGSTIHSGARILGGCVIGEGVVIFPNAVLYEDTQIGNRVIIHAAAVLGAYGFGYKQQDGRHELSAQLGNVQVEDDVEIGACATIDRGTYGPTVIGAGTKIDNQVMIAHNCRLGRHNLICSQVGIAGSTTTGDNVVMAGQVGVRDHVHIGAGAVLCSKSGVSNNVPDGEEMLGQPATTIRKQKLQVAALAKLPEMRREFRRLLRQVEQLQAQVDQSAAQDKAA